MRSEERFGIIYTALFLLWGTLITEPLRVFIGYFKDALITSQDFMHVSSGSKLGTALIVISFFVATIVLILTDKTSINNFVPCSIFCTALVVFVISSMADKTVDKRIATLLITTVVVIAVMHVFKLETVLLWFSDICTCSFSMFLTMGLIIKPLSELNGTMGKVLFMAKDVDYNLAAPMGGVFGVHEAIWGCFFGIFLLLPQIYMVFAGKRG